jgi:ATP-dependent helicase/nuclease subunit A
MGRSSPPGLGLGAGDREHSREGSSPHAALTAEQEQAAGRRSEPLLLSAGAGSGKTSVLVERFVRAVLEDGVAPGSILAITFTERAAGELRERVRRRFLELGHREQARDTEAAFVSTFHGFCARLLRTHPLLAGFDPDFHVLDEGLAGGLRERAFRSALADFLAGGSGDAVDLVAAYGVDQVQAMIAGAYTELRSRGERHPRLPVPEGSPAHDAVERDAEARAAVALLDRLLAGYGGAYEALKRKRGAVDFDDLELAAGELLDRHAGVRAAWSERFELLMVDEFQDTNRRQLAILEALDRGNLFTVGDELQSIYGFRHAEVDLFRMRAAELADLGRSLALTGNFRSRPALLEVINAVFSERIGASFSPLLARRHEADDADAAAPAGPGQEPLVELLLSAKSGWEDREEFAAVIGRGLPPAPVWRQAEARLLAQRIEQLVQGGLARPGEVVVLLRAMGDVEVYERALQLRGLRTLAVVGGFWGRLQTRDLLVYLRTLANPLDESALYQALASPLGGLTSDGLALLAHAARARGGGAYATARALAAGAAQAHSSAASDEWDGRLFDPDVPRADAEVPADAEGLANAEAGDDVVAEVRARLSAGDRAALSAFCARVEEERRGAAERPVAQLIERVIDASGYREHVLGLEWGERRLANIHKLLRLARRFEASEGRDLRAFLDHVERQDAAGVPEPDAPLDSVEPDAIRLMTIHAAKGLEFPVVCVADLGRAPNTRMPRLLLDGERVGLQLLRLDGQRAVAALDYEQLCEERRRAQAEEEDRILYVAMTRARERLLLSGALELERWTEPREATMIDWLGPLLGRALPTPPLEATTWSWELPVTDARAEVRCMLNTPASVGAVLRVPLPDPSSAPSSPSPGPSAPSHAPAAGGSPSALARARPTPQGRAQERAAATPEPALDARAAITSVSYSSLSALERCGYRYYLERVLGLAEDRAAEEARGPAGGLEARARGTLVHRLLESLDFAGASPCTAEDLARTARELGLRVSPSERSELAALIAAAQGAEPAARLRRATSVRREHPFAFSLGPEQPLVTGVMDVLAGEADGAELVLDYKSDRVGPELDLAAHVEREYGLQRLLYALAVLRGGAPSVEIVHWFLERPHESVAARYAASERALLEERLRRRLAAALRGGFSVSPRPHRALCLTCPGRGSLCSWGEEETLREQPSSAPDPAATAPSGI